MHNKSQKNIVVCGYPKSGSTWATRLTAQLLDCPSAGYWGFDGKTLVTEGQSRDSSFTCFKSHSHYDELAKDKEEIFKIIYIIRDPRDIVVSGMFHFNFPAPLLLKFLKVLPLPVKIRDVLKSLSARSKSNTYKIKRMIRMLTTGDKNIAHCQWALDDHINSFLGKPEVLIISYEALLKESLTEAVKILHHCQNDKPQEQIVEDLNAQSFEKKKGSLKPGSDKAKHLRKGVSGDWVNHLSIKDTKKIESLCKNEVFKKRYFA